MYTVINEKEFIEKVCKNTDSPLRPQIETIVRVLLGLQKILEENYDEYINAPLSINVVVNTGETVTRRNAFVVEYRETLRQFMAVTEQLKKLIDTVGVEEEMNALSSLKERFKVVK